MKWFMNKILDNSLNNYLSKAQLKELVRSLPAPGAVPWRYGHASARVESLREKDTYLSGRDTYLSGRKADSKLCLHLLPVVPRFRWN